MLLSHTRTSTLLLYGPPLPRYNTPMPVHSAPDSCCQCWKNERCVCEPQCRLLCWLTLLYSCCSCTRLMSSLALLWFSLVVVAVVGEIEDSAHTRTRAWVFAEGMPNTQAVVAEHTSPVCYTGQRQEALVGSCWGTHICRGARGHDSSSSGSARTAFAEDWSRLMMAMQHMCGVRMCVLVKLERGV